jgi:RND family efflux transporter MFP subunit
MVVAETQGKIQSVHFKLGQGVAKGKILVQVNATLQNAALEQAKKAVAAADLNLNVVKKLYDAGNASEAELTGAQTQASGAHAQLESAQKAFSDCSITAPIAGYIAQKDALVQPGGYCAPGTVITRIVDISSLKAKVPVGEMEVGLIKKGMPAEVRVPAVGSTVFAGKVVAVAAGSDPATGSYAVEVQWKNTRDRAIKSGMSASVVIKTATTEKVILVPASAVVERDRKDAVFVAAEGKAALRFVALGRTAGNDIEITDGIAEGDILITSAMTTLMRGDSVAPTVARESEDAQ